MRYEAKMARMVLDDCRYALTELRKDPTGQAWRVLWFGTLAMLRAVGHVLIQRDADLCHELKKANDDWWKNIKSTKPDPAIYWEFIDSGRDAILKQYDLRAGQGVAPLLTGTALYDRRGEQLAIIAPGGPITYTYPIYGGPFAGQDQREVVQDAIEWWEQQLTDIEADAARRAVAGSSPP